MVETVSNWEADLCSHFRWHHPFPPVFHSFSHFPPTLSFSYFYTHTCSSPIRETLSLHNEFMCCMKHYINLPWNNRKKIHQHEWICCTSCCQSNNFVWIFLIKLLNINTANDICRHLQYFSLLPFIISQCVTMKIHKEKQCSWGGNQGPVVCFSHFFISQAMRLAYYRNSIFSIAGEIWSTWKIQCTPVPPRIDLNRWILISIEEKMASVLCLPCLRTAGSQLLWLPV